MNRLELGSAGADGGGPGGVGGGGGGHYLTATPNWKYLYPFYPRPPTPPNTRNSPVYDLQSQIPPDISRDPRQWSRQHVQTWLQWCQEEFDLPAIDGAHFTMNGKALCLLLRSDFTERSPRAGDILYNVMQILLRDVSDVPTHSRFNGHLRAPNGYTNGGGVTTSDLVPEGLNGSWPTIISSDFHNLGHVLHQPRLQVSPSTSGVESTVTLSPAPSTDSHIGSPPRLHRVSPPTTGQNSPSDKENKQHKDMSDDDDSGTDSPLPSMVHNGGKKIAVVDAQSLDTTLTPREPITNGRLLWDFLHQLLNDPSQRYSSCIRWKNHESGVFKITDPNGLARLWGLQKNHLNMNFDKMSRALRYYYRVNILRKVQGERHCYQFLRQPTELKNCKQRALLNNFRASDKPLDMSMHRTMNAILLATATIKTEDVGQ